MHQIDTVIVIAINGLTPAQYQDSLIILKLLTVFSNKKTLQALNACRLFLNARWMSEIMSADGLQIMDIRKLKTLSNRHTLSPQLRRHPELNQLKWKLWDTYLLLIGIMSSTSKIIIPLGK